MQDIKQREEKIKEKRKQTTFRDFVKEICSRYPLVLHKNRGLISKYPHTSRIQKLISVLAFEKDRDLLIKKGQSYEIHEPFLSQMESFFKSFELPSLLNYGGCENADFAEGAHMGKNIYLTFLTTWGCENVMYSLSVKDACINILNSTMILEGSQNIYQSFGIINGFNVFYSKYIQNSGNIRFSTNLIGCQECIFCDKLQNQSYCIHNQQLSKEEYLTQKINILHEKQQFASYYTKFCNDVVGENIQSKNVDGTFMINCSDIHEGYFNFNLEKGRNVILIQSKEPNQDMYDCFMGGRSHDFYGEVGSGGFCDNVYSGIDHNQSSHVYYSIMLDSCSYCLGCVGLKNKSFCIFNKEYSKEERFELANKIFEQMDADGTLGKFFPASMNPFYFNDTAAYLIDDSFTKEEVTKEGYLWRDEEIKVDVPEGAEVIYVKKDEKDKNDEKTLSDFQGFDQNGEWKIDPEILKKVIKDEKGNYYRIVKMEYDFLMKHGLPLPELHWLERIKLGFRFK